MEETGAQRENRWSRLGPGLSTLHLFTLASLAVAKPLYDTTARDAAFFVVRGSRPVDVISLIVVLSLIIPGLMALLMLAAGFAGKRTRLSVQYLMVAGLCSLYAAQFLKLLDWAGGVAGLIAIPALGLTAAILYAGAKPVRQMITVISPVCLIFPLFFVFNSQIGQIILPSKDISAESYDIKLKNKPPIVFVLLDELPVETLLDARGDIDAKRFPSLATFAKDAYWFKNTTVNAVNTTLSIPSILSGISPVKKLLPNIDDHPDNLFTLLAGSYKFNVWEPVTTLCPERLRRKENEVTYEDRMGSLLSDMAVVYLHIIIPANYSGVLPSIATRWGNFTSKDTPDARKPASQAKGQGILARSEREASDRPKLFEQFTGSIENEEGTLNFIHFMMPHGPFQYLPSCRQYPAVYEDRDGIRMQDDMFRGPQGLISEMHQLHIMQMACVDRLWGELFEHLKEKGIYDKALIVFTADHGVSFQANDYHRRVSLKNAADIMFTPLLIKVPNQRKGAVKDFDAEGADILPTIADVLGIEIPWHVTGRSLLAPHQGLRSGKILLDEEGMVHSFSYQKLLDDKAEAHDRNIKLFGLDDESSTFYWFGRYRELMDRPVSDFEVVKGDYIIRMEQSRALFDHIDLEDNFLPEQIRGKVLSSGGVREPKVVVSLNGLIQTVLDTYEIEGDRIFNVILPETSFRQGKNDIEFYILLEGAKVRLGLSSSQVISFELSEDQIISSKGDKFRIVDKALKGHIDHVGKSTNNLMIIGWAADINRARLVDAVLVFSDGKAVYAGDTNIARPDVGQAFGKDGFKKCGFSFILSEQALKDSGDVRIFAIANGVASEIYYPGLKGEGR